MLKQREKMRIDIEEFKTLLRREEKKYVATGETSGLYKSGVCAIAHAVAAARSECGHVTLWFIEDM